MVPNLEVYRGMSSFCLIELSTVQRTQWTYFPQADTKLDILYEKNKVWIYEYFGHSLLLYFATHVSFVFDEVCYSLIGHYPWSWTWCPVSCGSFSWPLPLQDTQRAVHCSWRHVHRPVCVLWEERWILNESYRVPY